MTTPSSIDVDEASRGTDMRRMYAGVVAVEALVLLAIWIFQRYFGG
jgi:hypothetical protein